MFVTSEGAGIGELSKELPRRRSTIWAHGILLSLRIFRGFLFGLRGQGLSFIGAANDLVKLHHLSLEFEGSCLFAVDARPRLETVVDLNGRTPWQRDESRVKELEPPIFDAVRLKGAVN